MEHTIEEHISVIKSTKEESHSVSAAAGRMRDAISNDKKVVWAGNGGSAADCQHLSAELVGRFQDNSDALPSIALTTDTSALTAVANDFGYEEVFSRQVSALVEEGDVLVGISTSGESENVIRAAQKASSIGATTVAMTGRGGGRLSDIVDISISVESKKTTRIQEAHIMIGHILCRKIKQK
jgi:D-sedoheptulose 7-phosphate isomerase